MRLKKLFLVVCLIFMLSLSSFLAQAESKLEADFHQRIENPTDIYQMLDYFARLKGSWEVHQGEELVQNVNIGYNYLGTEMVQGTEAEKISLEIDNQGADSTLFYFWLSQTEIMQMEVEGQLIPKEMANLMADQVLDNIFAPFTSLEKLNLEQLEAKGKAVRSREVIAGQEREVITIQADNLEQEMEISSGTVKLAEFDQFLVVISYQYQRSAAAESVERVNFKVEEIEIR